MLASVIPWLSAGSVVAQLQGTTTLPDRIIRVPGGFLGIVEEGALTRLTRYNRSFQQVTASAVFGLRPIQLMVSEDSTIAKEAWLLARPLGSPVLFRVPLDGPPDPVPAWRDDRVELTQIVAAGELDSIAGIDILMAGDSAVVLVSADGIERFRIRDRIVSTFTSASHFLLVTDDPPSTITVSLHSSGSGRAIASRNLPWLRDPLVQMADDGRSLIIASSSGKPRAYILANDHDLTVTEHAIPSLPFAFVPSNDLHVGAVSRSYPSPELFIVGAGDHRRLDYPLREVFQSVAVGRSLAALVARDSAAIYDRSWRLIQVVPSPGSSHPDLIEIGGGEAVLSTDEGAVRFRINRSETMWIVRHWQLILGLVGLLLVVAILLGFAARYAEITSIYFNLVGVPSSHGVIVLSRTQRVRRMNASAQAMLGISPYIPLGRHLSEYLNREEHRKAMADARTLFSTGEPFERRVDVPAELGTRALTFRGRTMLSRGGFRAGYLLLVEDVTQTIEKERLVNWASVAHHIAHEMKTPLGTVQLTAEMLRDRLGTNGQDDEYLRAANRILKQSERLRAIVEDLLTVARTESLQKVRADVGLLLASIVHEYGELMPPGSDLRLAISGEDHRSQVDVQQLTVAIRNLLDNARHAIGSREGGRLAVSLASEERNLRIIVEDNGAGMRPETLARLFQPFYSEREGGSGIGTVIIKRVFEAHGGSVNVVSTPGVGTRFTLELPRA